MACGGTALGRQAACVDVSGSVDDRSLTRVLAIARKELDDFGTVKPFQDELELLKWRLGAAYNVAYVTNDQLAQGMLATRLAGLPSDFVQRYPDLLAAVTLDDVVRVAGACRKTAVLLVSGDPGVVAQAVQSTMR